MYCSLRPSRSIRIATRAAGVLVGAGVRAADRVLLLSHNAPEWGMTYFGVIKAGAICVPVDPESLTDEVINFVRASNAAGVVLSAEMAERHADLSERLRAAGLDAARLWTFDEVFALPPQAVEDERIALLPARVQQQSIASLIFTSGTTGQPKGVMLSHKNFTHMVSMLASVFDMTTSDGVLSVLPLHHTFEFSTGFLTPLSRGAQITYLPELTGEELRHAIKNGHVTGMVGVPALWELLHRRIKSRFNERARWIGEAADLLIKANGWLRDNTPLNFGQFVFRPIHQGMGGRMRYLISGGSALNEKVKRDFHGLGFTILEGYGLTEASPVITVTRPQNKLNASSVGKALPGVEVKIVDPNEVGVGEVIARGANIMSGYYNNEEATRHVLVNRWLYTGDLGRLDDEGNLYLVGRSKEIIVDTNGKNVYPDEIEELYADSPYIKELSVVGLPDGSLGEKVACMVVPDEDHDISLQREEVRRKVEEHFRDVSSALPFFKRVKVLHFSDSELPRTATRKVKRREVVAQMQGLEQTLRTLPDGDGEAAATTTNAQRKKERAGAAWLLDIVAQVANRPRADITLDSRLGDLGFDSLMYVELATAIEAAGGTLKSPDTLTEVRDLRELAAIVTRQPTQAEKEEARAAAVKQERREDEELYIPSFVRTVGNKGLDVLQRAFYERLLHMKCEGCANIPAHANFLVAANHTSHLDMGLVKMALGEHGRDLVALAAADYFFDNKYKRAYMDNFTNLVPMERSGSLRKSLRHALSFLERGYNALIFPEGTRSLTGEMAEFKPVIGLLALTARVGILPVYIHGAYEALPKGSNMLKSRDVSARVGRFIEIEELEALTKGVPKSEGYRLIAAYVRHRVENLRDRTNQQFDAATLRRQWKAERRAAHHADEDAADQLATTGD